MKNTRKSHSISQDEELKIIQWYEGHTLRDTAHIFSRDRKTIIKVLIKNNIYIRTTAEDLLIAKEKIKQTCLEKYGVENPMQSTEIKEKAKQTCIEKYNCTSYLETKDCKEKAKQICLEKYGVENFLALDENKAIAKAAIKEKYGVEYAMQNTIVKDKKILTQRKNKHLNTSKPEELFYTLLLENFEQTDIERQYDKDTRYPYLCDFYIKSLDLFIEINHYYTHGTHPYDENNQEDIKKLEELKIKKWDHVINTWTIRDVEKYKKAKEENLNYLMYYPKDALTIEKVLEFKLNK